MGQYTLGLTRSVGHGRAFSQLSPVPKPAVAAGFTIRISSPYWEMGDSLSFALVTDGNAADRFAVLSVKDGQGVTIAQMQTGAAITASKTGQVTFLGSFDSTVGATDGPLIANFPQVWLQPDYSIVLAVTGIQVGDQINNIRWYRQRFTTGSDGYLLGVVEDDSPELEQAVRIASVLA